MRKLNILVPSAGHPTRPGLFKCFRENGEREVYIVGVDMQADGIAPHIADKFHQVPARKDPAYMEIILDICRREGIDVYYALGEEEAIAATARRQDFTTIGVSVISPGSPEMVAISINKCRWHDFLEEKGIAHACYRNIYRFNEIEKTIRALGYPEEDVFVKPAVARGGRGAAIITASNVAEEFYYGRSGEPKMSLASFLELSAPFASGDFPTLLAMEYLPGTYYSVDVLSREGEPYYVIPKIRIQGTASNTTVGQVDLNPDAAELATEICKAFQFSYLQNYEMKLNKADRPMVYDINPRGGTSLPLCAAAGANIAYYAVKMAVGEEIPQVEVRDKVRMIRFYDEYYLEY